eukprot:4577478-Alexandrium_andersonii.AAC.1
MSVFRLMTPGERGESGNSTYDSVTGGLPEALRSCRSHTPCNELGALFSSRSCGSCASSC